MKMKALRWISLIAVVPEIFVLVHIGGIARRNAQYHRTLKAYSVVLRPGMKRSEVETLLHMREEIKKGADWLWEFQWALRYTDSVDNPFVLTEAPFLAVGDRPGTIGQMLHDPETLLFFPICWQACLLGSRRRFDKETDNFGQAGMQTFRKKYWSYANVFLVSPTELEDITALTPKP